MNSDFLKLFTNLAAVNVAETPNYVTALAIARHPQAIFQFREQVAFSIKIDVDYAFIKDRDFDTVITAYVTTMNNLYSQLSKDVGEDELNPIFLGIVKNMTLKYCS